MLSRLCPNYLLLQGVFIVGFRKLLNNLIALRLLSYTCHETPIYG